MDVRVSVEEVDAVAGDERVCHYDELGERAKQRFPSFVGEGEVTVDEETGRELCGCDLVKYTEYYQVSRA